jgi:hypothetical protein
MSEHALATLAWWCKIVFHKVHILSLFFFPVALSAINQIKEEIDAFAA